MNTNRYLIMALVGILASVTVSAQLTRPQAMAACTASGYDFMVGSSSWDGTAFQTSETGFDYGITVDGTQFAASFTTDKRVKAVLVDAGDGLRILEPTATTGTLTSESGITDLVFCTSKSLGSDHGTNTHAATSQDGNARTGEFVTDGGEAYEVPEYNDIAVGILVIGCIGLIMSRRK